jgi:hypothetical protein
MSRIHRGLHEIAAHLLFGVPNGRVGAMFQKQLGTTVMPISSGSHQGSVTTDSPPIYFSLLSNQQFHCIELRTFQRSLFDSDMNCYNNIEPPDQRLHTKLEQNSLSNPCVQDLGLC